MDGVHICARRKYARRKYMPGAPQSWLAHTLRIWAVHHMASSHATRSVLIHPGMAYTCAIHCLTQRSGCYDRILYTAKHIPHMHTYL